MPKTNQKDAKSSRVRNAFTSSAAAASTALQIHSCLSRGGRKIDRVPLKSRQQASRLARRAIKQLATFLDANDEALALAQTQMGRNAMRRGGS